MVRLLRVVAGFFLCAAAFKAPAKNLASEMDARPPRQEVVASLRAHGPNGLAEALHTYDRLRQEQERLQQQANQLSTDFAGKKESLAAIEKQMATLEPNLKAWQAAIDQIGGQRGCTVSRLYWYTDLADAKAAAAQTGRPILSLRMLGKLTDEYSCANSRFFRTALYSNKNIGDFLRDNFILHWQSVRPAPRVTIDFGDGRKLERTITGNSAHYVLASDGTPLDVLPGLYSPLAFRQWLWELRNFQLSYAAMPAGDRPAKLREFHTRFRDEILRNWDADIQRLGQKQTELVSMRIESALASSRLAGKQATPDPAPKAVKAAVRAVGKTQVEAPVLRFANLGGTWMEARNGR